MMPTFDERTCEQVHAAIRRQAEREAAGEMRGRSELARFAAAAQGLAILAVQNLAQERSTSVEAVLDRLIEHAGEEGPAA